MIAFTKTLSSSEENRQYLDLVDDTGKSYGRAFPPHGTDLVIITEYRSYSAVKRGENQIAGDFRDWYSCEAAHAGDVIRIEYDGKAPERFGGIPIKISFLSRGGLEASEIPLEDNIQEEGDADSYPATPGLRSLRRLNKQGIDRFADFLDALAGQPSLPRPAGLLTDPQFSEEVVPPVQIEDRTFGSRFAAAEYLFNLFKESGLTGIERDQGLWAWLSLFYFEELCPADGRDRRRPGERARWLLNLSARRYYRHLLAGAYNVYQAHEDRPERTIALLCGPLHQTSDVFLELADSQELVTNRSIMEIATILYYDPDSGKPKRRVARNYPGGARRFGEVLAQFDCTWDLYSVDVTTLLGMLPKEFDRFKPQLHSWGR